MFLDDMHPRRIVDLITGVAKATAAALDKEIDPDALGWLQGLTAPLIVAEYDRRLAGDTRGPLHTPDDAVRNTQKLITQAASEEPGEFLRVQTLEKTASGFCRRFPDFWPFCV